MRVVDPEGVYLRSRHAFRRRLLSVVSLDPHHESNFNLRWYGTLEYGDFHEKFNFFTMQDLRPLNTCQKHFEMILPNFPLDECEI